jgi:hypothetical protein
MITLPQNRTSNKKIHVEQVTYKGGTNKLLNEAKIGLDEALTSKNLLLVGDGQWKPRWGTAYYGADVGSTIDGAAEYVKSDGTTEVVAIAGGVAYHSQDGGAWSSISGATFTAGVQCYFMQITGFLYIANGTDKLARYNGTVLSTYNQISAPTGLGGTRGGGLSAGSFNLYAQVTALNDIGETVGSTEASTTVNKSRDAWTTTSGVSNKVTWTWNTVSTANRYQFYLSDEEGDETLLTSTTSLSFVDDGSLELNPYVIPPEDNTTSAPKFKSMCVSGNRIWATNNNDDMYKVYFSGTGQYIGVFSDFYGGGWINLEKGGREIPQAVVHYQSGQGEGRLTTLCKTPEGKGAVWQITITSATVGSTTFSVPSATKVVGSFGTESLLGVVQTTNDIMFPNRRGWFNLGPRQNYFGILRTEEISAKIRPYWKSLEGSKIAGICSYFYDAKVFISVPTTTAGNTRILILDTERSCWIVDWTIGAKQFFESTDTSGVTHLLYVPLTGNQLIEIGENIQGDLGVAFSTDYTSGRYPLDKLWKEFARVDKVFIKLGQPRGLINFEVSGSEKRGGFRGIESATITPQYSSAGLGWDQLGSVQLGDSAGETSLFSDSADIRYVAVRKKLRDVQFRLTTNTIDSDYTLLGIILEGRPLRVNSPRAWKA